MKTTPGPDYIRIYGDLIAMKYPEKKDKCKTILSKRSLSSLDVIKLEKLLFEHVEKEFNLFNQAHKSYNEQDILEILVYQKEKGLNNSQVARDLKLSRNSLSRWRKIYQSDKTL